MRFPDPSVTVLVRDRLACFATVYGELLGAAQLLVDQLGELDPVTQQFLTAAGDTAAGDRR